MQPEIDTELLKELCKKDITWDEVSKYFKGVPTYTIKRIAKKHNIKKEKVKSKRKKNTKTSRLTREEVLGHIGEGITWSDLSKKLNLSQETLRTFCLDNNIDKPSKNHKKRKPKKTPIDKNLYKKVCDEILTGENISSIMKCVGEEINKSPEYIQVSLIKKFGPFPKISNYEKQKISFENTYTYEDIKKFRRENLSLKNIAQKLETSLSFIKRYIKENGGCTKNRYTKDDIDFIVKYYNDNNSIHDLVRIYNCNKQAIYAVLKKAGIDTNKGSGIYGKKTEFNNVMYDSSFEALVAKVIYENFDLEVKRQYRYSNTKMTADFYFPDIDLYIEVSSFNSDKYLNKIDLKRKMVKNFLFINNPCTEQIYNELKLKIEDLTNAKAKNI